ncbi:MULTISPECIES: GNAT family N-acetyltransferase [Bacillus]|uniref:GNAT family N-acetyltransferase n=1 Tax=Bacillus TaxID=1386 RepID=UPI0028825F9D|nr:GNAT family N-acetyltransferase [Bacillus sp. AG4(2022)]MDT0161341.1 GNAT family N-acetyltransferase [Bacillus sp. AG4(2022)]
MIYDQSNNIIFTNRLLLRLFQVSDAETVARLCDNYNLYKSTLYLPYPYELKDALTWMEKHLDNFKSERSYELAVTDRQTGELYGAIALSNNQMFHHGELAYWIGEEYWGKGYATEAAEAVIRFAFEEKKYHKVFARYFQSNPASGRVMEKLGMKEEGVFVDHVRKEGRYENLVCYGLINPVDK